MNRDISDILDEWEFRPGHLSARIIAGTDGEPRVQVRLDLGIIQMHVEGRPDGLAPFAFPSLLDYHEAMVERAKQSDDSFDGPDGPDGPDEDDTDGDPRDNWSTPDQHDRSETNGDKDGDKDEDKDEDKDQDADDARNAGSTGRRSDPGDQGTGDAGPGRRRSSESKPRPPSKANDTPNAVPADEDALPPDAQTLASAGSPEGKAAPSPKDRGTGASHSGKGNKANDHANDHSDDAADDDNEDNDGVHDQESDDQASVSGDGTDGSDDQASNPWSGGRDEAGDASPLTPAECRALREEVSQYNQRAVALLALDDFARVVRDTSRNLRVVDFCKQQAGSEGDRNALEQYRPYFLAMRYRALTLQLMRDGEPAAALFTVDEGLELLQDSFSGAGKSRLLEHSAEYQALRELRDGLVPKLPLSQRAELKQRLARALEQENYELAAILRDELKQLTDESAQ